MPPQLTVNLNNLALPPINFGAAAQPLDQEQLAALVQQTVQASVQQGLNAAIQNGIQELMKVLPVKGFEHITFNSGWKREA